MIYKSHGGASFAGIVTVGGNKLNVTGEQRIDESRKR